MKRQVRGFTGEGKPLLSRFFGTDRPPARGVFLAAACAGLLLWMMGAVRALETVSAAEAKRLIEEAEVETTPAEPVNPSGVEIYPPQNGSLRATIWTDAYRYYEGDPVRVYFRTTQDAYVYIFDRDTEGQTRQLFPNYYDRENFVRGGATYRIPDQNYGLRVSGPSGWERLEMAAVSSLPESLRVFSTFEPDAPYPLRSGGMIEVLDKVNEENVRLLSAARGQAAAQTQIVPEPQEAPYPYPPILAAWADTTFLVSRERWIQTGRVRVTSYPSGASIYFNGEYLGCTPRIFETACGYYDVRLEMPGYEDEVRNVWVTNDVIQRVSFTLRTDYWDTTGWSFYYNQEGDRWGWSWGVGIYYPTYYSPYYYPPYYYPRHYYPRHHHPYWSWRDTPRFREGDSLIKAEIIPPWRRSNPTPPPRTRPTPPPVERRIDKRDGNPPDQRVGKREGPVIQPPDRNRPPVVSPPQEREGPGIGKRVILPAPVPTPRVVRDPRLDKRVILPAPTPQPTPRVERRPSIDRRESLPVATPTPRVVREPRVDKRVIQPAPEPAPQPAPRVERRPSIDRRESRPAPTPQPAPRVERRPSIDRRESQPTVTPPPERARPEIGKRQTSSPPPREVSRPEPGRIEPGNRAIGKKDVSRGR